MADATFNECGVLTIPVRYIGGIPDADWFIFPVNIRNIAFKCELREG